MPRLSGQKNGRPWGRPFFRMCFITGLVPEQLLAPEQQEQLQQQEPEQLLVPEQQEQLLAPERQQALQQEPELLLLFWRSQ